MNFSERQVASSVYLSIKTQSISNVDMTLFLWHFRLYFDGDSRDTNWKCVERVSEGRHARKVPELHFIGLNWALKFSLLAPDCLTFMLMFTRYKLSVCLPAGQGAGG